MTAVHLAQLNVGRLVAPLDDPAIDDFRDNLAHVNALGEAAPGFVWRLVGADEGTGATDLRWPDAPDDERFITNLTVWTDVDALRAFAHRGEHAAFFRRRREWFEPMADHLVLWWVPAGHRPSLTEASERLRILRTHGPGPEAFTLRAAFPPAPPV
jgi:hypothetical protein